MNRINIAKKLRGSEGDIGLDVDIEIKKGELSVLFGKSGAGKSSILRMVAGLLEADRGMIEIDGEVWFDSSKKINIPPQKRKVGFVFQDYALFPNMSVEKNLLYALDDKKKRSKVEEILEVTELLRLKDEMPATLSGGQKQRVALARALVREPKILLLDEPLSALDFTMRSKLQDELLNIQKYFNLTTILVSHDISEVYKLANTVFELERGTIKKSGSPHKIFGKEGLSGKFRFNGEVIGIEPSDILFVVSVLVGNDTVKIVANKEEIEGLEIGSKVILSSKAFNPLIIKI